MASTIILVEPSSGYDGTDESRVSSLEIGLIRIMI